MCDELQNCFVFPTSRQPCLFLSFLTLSIQAPRRALPAASLPHWWSCAGLPLALLQEEKGFPTPNLLGTCWIDTCTISARAWGCCRAVVDHTEDWGCCGAVVDHSEDWGCCRSGWGSGSTHAGCSHSRHRAGCSQTRRVARWLCLSTAAMESDIFGLPWRACVLFSSGPFHAKCRMC